MRTPRCGTCQILRSLRDENHAMNLPHKPALRGRDFGDAKEQQPPARWAEAGARCSVPPWRPSSPLHPLMEKTGMPPGGFLKKPGSTRTAYSEPQGEEGRWGSTARKRKADERSCLQPPEAGFEPAAPWRDSNEGLQRPQPHYACARPRH